jgi:hypothetical protein
MSLYCVVGMHRSGTSVVSRMLALLGANLGPPEDLMPPKPDNPTGFWESSTVTQIHDDLLAALGGRWDAPTFAEEGWEREPRLRCFLERIEAVAQSHFSQAPVSVWKDPRGSILLPAWRAVTDVAGVVLVLRDPGEVAASLGRRNAIAEPVAIRLWLQYTAEALRHAPEYLLITHRDLYARPQWVASRLATHCGLSPPSESTLETILDFVDPAQRSGATTPEGGALLPAARALYRTLVREQRDVALPIASVLRDYLRVTAEVSFVRDRLARVL